MNVDATESPELALVRGCVPEFESRFQDELREEDGELGVFRR